MKYYKETPHSQAGFTITELSLAMSLLSVLLIILLISAINFVNIYNKGITLKRVNQSGANIGQELQTNLRRSIQNTPRYAVPGDATSPVSGVCTGRYSFIWSVYLTTDSDTPTFPINYDTDGPDTQPVYFAKVKDNLKEMCGLTPPSPYIGSDSTHPYQSTELLGDGLVVRDPSTPDNPGGLAVIVSPDGKLTTTVFTLSTNGGEPILGDGTDRATCQGGSKEQAFCALNTFVITTYSKKAD